MSALKDINSQIYSSLEKGCHDLEISDSTVNLIENSFSIVEQLISSSSVDEVAHEEVNDVARNTILICTLSYKVASWLPELPLNTWRRYISYLKEFSQIISETLAKEMWQRLVKYFREEFDYLRNGSNESNDETIKNSIKLLLYLAQRLSASIFFFCTRFSSLECGHSIDLLCAFHSLLQDMKSSAGLSIEEKSRLNFHKKISGQQRWDPCPSRDPGSVGFGDGDASWRGNGRQISDSLIQDNMSRLVTHLHASALTFTTQLWSTVLGVVISQSLCCRAVHRPNPHSFGTAQRSVSIIYSCVLCLFSSLQDHRSKEAIVGLVWKRFEQIHLESSTTAGFDSPRLPGMPPFITEPFLSANECCNHYQELFCPCSRGAAAVTSARAAAVEVLFTCMPVDFMVLSTECLDRYTERCLDCVKEASNPGAISCKSVGLALSFLLSVVRHQSGSSPATAQLISKHRAAYLGHVGIGTNILNWMKVLGDYIKKASSTSSGFHTSQSNNGNHTHTPGVYRLQRMQNIISFIGKLSLMLGPRKKVPAVVQSILLDISLSLAHFLKNLVDIIRDNYLVLEKKRNNTAGAGRLSGPWETILVSCDVALTCAESVKNILSIGFSGASSTSPAMIAERYLRVMETLIAACVVSRAPVNLTWRLWSITVEGAYASKGLLRDAIQGEGMQRHATTADVTLPLLLTICNDRDNPSHTYYTHEDVANLPSILDYLDLCTL
eukprot:gene31675-41118_t